MTSRNDLDLEQKVKLIKDKENGMSVRELKDKFNVSIGSSDVHRGWYCAAAAPQ